MGRQGGVCRPSDIPSYCPSWQCPWPSPRPASAATSSTWQRTTVAHANQSPAQSPTGCENADTRPGGASANALEKSTVCLLNKTRARRGLRKLRLNHRLSRAAYLHTATW